MRNKIELTFFGIMLTLCLNAETPAGWWRFAEHSGTVAYDDGDNGLNGTLNTNFVSRHYNAPGKGAAVFSKAQRFLSRQDESCVLVRNFPAMVCSNAFTITAWVRPEELSPYAPIAVQTSDLVAWTDGFGLFVAEDGALGAFVGGSKDDDFFSAGVLKADVWSHVAMVCNGADVSLYIDSRKVESKRVKRKILSCATQTLFIGTLNCGRSTQPFIGAISDVRIYAKALPHSCIADIYRQFIVDAISPNGDDDADGMTNSWEVHYGLNPRDARDAKKDNDGDGILNLDEYRRGSNPSVGVAVKNSLIRSSTATSR